MALLAILIGLPIAWLVGRTDLWGRRLLAALCLGPAILPPFSGLGLLLRMPAAGGDAITLLVVLLIKTRHRWTTTHDTCFLRSPFTFLPLSPSTLLPGV